MAFFDDLGKKITSAGQEAIEKTKNATGVARINSLVSEEEKFISECYRRLGEAFYTKYGTSDDADLQQHIDCINLSISKIAAYRDEIYNLKGVRPCATCGVEIPVTSVFCPHCGNRSDNYVPPVPTEAKCVGCGETVDLSLSFCTNCGTKIQK